MKKFFIIAALFVSTATSFNCQTVTAAPSTTSFDDSLEYKTLELYVKRTVLNINDYIASRKPADRDYWEQQRDELVQMVEHGLDLNDRDAITDQCRSLRQEMQAQHFRLKY